MAKLTYEQKYQLRELRKKIATENKYVPRGQGDSVNQHLTLMSLYREVASVKADPNFRSNRII